jgi:hypothetical protein
MALRSGRVLHPLFHWVPQLAAVAAHPEFAHHPLFPQVRRFYEQTFNTWDESARAIFG